MQTYQAKCTKEIFWKEKYRHAGDILELTREELDRLGQADVIVRMPIQTMSVAPPENRVIKIIKNGRVRG